MKGLIKATMIALILATQSFAASQELKKLDEDQVLLTRQLNFAEKLGESHGRYVILRDSHLLGHQGVIKLGENVNRRVEAWLKKWTEILQPLASQDWTDTLQSPELQQKIDRQNADLEKLAELYGQFESTIRTGARLAAKLPKYDLTEFQKAKAKGNPRVVFLDWFGQHVQLINGQFTQIQQTFSESEKALQAHLITQLRQFSFRVTNSLKLITSMKRVNFPQLAEELRSLEKTLGTIEQLTPLQGLWTSSYEAGLQGINGNRLLESETLIKDLEARLNSDFAAFENKPQYDQERVQQSKALARMQLNDLKNNLRNRIASFGGRAAMLVARIKDQSTKGASSPLAVCRSNGSRVQYDCNLFRSQVVPFLPRLQELDESVLLQITRTLQQVLQGPLAGEVGI